MPIVLQLAKVGSVQSSPLLITAAALGASTVGGRVRLTLRLGDSVAFWVMSVTTCTPLSAMSRVADTWNWGANGSIGASRDLQRCGRRSGWSDRRRSRRGRSTLAAGVGQVAGSRRPVKVLLSSVTEIGALTPEIANVSGRLVKRLGEADPSRDRRRGAR